MENDAGDAGFVRGAEVRAFSVFGLGTVVVDHLVFLGEFPERDTKNEAGEHFFQVGGPVPTALAAIARFGGRAAFQGRWANDHLGRMIEDELRERGIEFDAPVCEGDSQTGFAHVWVERESGRRTSVFHRGSHDVQAADVAAEKIARFDALHLDGWSTPAAIKAAQAMRAAGGRVFLDLGSPKEDLERLLACVDVLNCPIRLLDKHFGETDPAAGGRRLLELGPEQVTVTDGERGAWLLTKEGAIHQDAFAVEAVDTNGAGDTFAGAIVFGSMQGWPVVRQLSFACAAAAVKCSRRGNRDALPKLGEVEAILERHSAL